MADPKIQIVDPQSGTVAEVPADVAQTEWLAGRAALAPEQQIPMLAPDGKTVMHATPDRVQDAIQDGWRFAT